MPKHAGADDETLRQHRLVFYAEAVGNIDAALNGFLERSKANCALLVDVEGHMVTQTGFTGGFDTTSIAALVAGSFASTQALAKTLGEQEFSSMFHQGAKDNIHISLVAKRCLLVIIFDDRTTVGMVRLAATEVTEHIDSIIAEMQANPPEEPNPVGEESFRDEANSRIDEFFGE